MIELQSVDCNKEEQETVINIPRDGDKLTLYTSDNTMVTKMQKILNTEGTEWTLDQTFYNKDGHPTGYEFSAPKKMALLRPKKKGGRELTEEERKALGERLRGFKGSSDAAINDIDEDED